MSSVQTIWYINRQIKKSYYNWLSTAMSVLEPKIVLELGTQIGKSFLSMYQPDIKNCKIITVDRDTYPNSLIMGRFEDKENCHFLIGDDTSEIIFDKISSILNGEKIDFLFIDSEHSKAHVEKQMEMYLPLLREGALVAIDDINITYQMKDVWSGIKYPKVELNNLHSTGFGVFVYTGELDG